MGILEFFTMNSRISGNSRIFHMNSRIPRILEFLGILEQIFILEKKDDKKFL